MRSTVLKTQACITEEKDQEYLIRFKWLRLISKDDVVQVRKPQFYISFLGHSYRSDRKQLQIKGNTSRVSLMGSRPDN